MCVAIPRTPAVKFVDASAEVTHEDGHTHFHSAMLALVFLSRRIPPFLSFVDREVELDALMICSFSNCWISFLVLFYFIFLRGEIPLV